MKQSTLFVFRASGVLGAGVALPLILYGVVQSVILSELPCPHADETAILFSHSDRIPGERLGLSGPNLADLAAGVQSFQAIGAVALLGTREVHLPGGVETFREAYFSGSLPSVLGISPIRGRWFQEDESRSGPPVAVIVSERFWRIRLGADPAVQGTVLHIRWRREEVPVAVVGVLPSLQILSLVYKEEPDIVFPASNLSEWYRRDSTLYQAVVRLRPGVPIDQVRGEIRRSAERLRNTYPRDNREFDPRILSLRSAILGKTERLLWSLFLATGVVWLIAAANFSALLAVRLEERQSEFAVRWALGARPRHLMIAISKEVAVVAMVGSGIGTLAGWIGVRLLQTHAQWFNVPRLIDARLSPTALLFGVSAALCIGLVGVLANAGRYVRSSTQGLVQTAPAQRSSPSIHFSEFVVATQFCLALVIVNTACLAGHSLVRDESRALGYDAHHVAAMQIRLPAPQSLVEKRRQQEVLQSFIDYAQGVPGVQTRPEHIRVQPNGISYESSCPSRTTQGRRAPAWQLRELSLRIIFKRWAFRWCEAARFFRPRISHPMLWSSMLLLRGLIFPAGK
jgi:putative ABC transport system permease protein